MTAFVKNPVFRALSDIRVGAVLLLVICVASAIATFIESHYASIGSPGIGRAASYGLVYDAIWFNAVLSLLFVNMFFSLVRRLARGRFDMGFVLVHVGILVILAGAGMTRWFGFEGYLRIREGESNNVVASARDYAIVTESGTDAKYPVRLFKAGPQGLHRTVSLPGGDVVLGVDSYWPRFERRLMPGPGGIAMATFGVMTGGAMRMHTLKQGDLETIGGVQVRFHPGDLPPAGDPTARYGQIRARVGDDRRVFDVVPEPRELGECGGWRFEVTEFQSDFQVGGESDPDGPLINPMVRLLVTNPEGESAEKVLFALHPEFSTMHEQAELLTRIDVLYEISSGVDLAKQDDQIVMRASFPVTVESMEDEGVVQDIAAGEVVPLALQRIYTGSGTFKIMPSELGPSMVQQPALSNRPGSPAAARLYVEVDGERAEAVCIHGGGAQDVRLGGRVFGLTYGSVMRTLPYDIFLEDFVLETYPGSDNPASYESHVRLSDPERGVDDRPVRIWMNHPLNHRGRKHFQSSYDRDRRGTVLSVNQDPGKMPTYIGYIIISLGFLVIMARILIERSRVKDAAAGLALLVVALSPFTDQAQAQHPADASAQAPPHLNLPDDIREQVATLIVQDFRGRMKPIDTLARETAIKVTKKTTFEGRHPIDVFLGFVVHSSHWYSYPTIAVKNNGVKKLLGVSRDVHHVSLASLMEGGRYKLQTTVEEAHRTAANQRNKTQQKLILFDERVHILYAALQGSGLRIFPVPDAPDNTWKELPEVLKELGDGDPRRIGFEQAGDALIGGLETGDLARIREGLRLTANLQKQFGADVIPSDMRITSELQLNHQHFFAKATLPYMAAFVLLIIAYFWGLFARDSKPWSWRSPLFAAGMLCFTAGFAVHLYGFVLRWIASGRAPLSNGHESLLWVALTVGFAGLVFELGSRSGAVGALGGLLAALVLGMSLMAAFDPAIGPLVPVLASYWLNIHVTIITASYAFLGLCCLLGLLTMILVIIAGLTKRPLGVAVAKLDRLNTDVMIVGLAMLTVGTLLGGVWANESWGRYWGWDPKETWALVSVLVYALILHFRWIPSLANLHVHAVGSFMAIWSIIMTYFGVNYLLVGLHSYAAGDSVGVPRWVWVTFLVMVGISIVATFAWGEARTRLKTKN